MTMTVLTEGKHTAEFILSEGNGSISREEVTIAAAAGALAAGTVVGKITASGKYVAYSNAAADGSEVAAGVLYRAVPDAAADQGAVIIARSAEVVGAELTGLDAAGTADLAALGIIVR
jgi:hypothetical protein